MNTFKFLMFSFAITTQFAFAEGIATDGTMGAAQTLTGANVTIPQTLGTTVGNNLFHSFADFNINTGQTATFAGGDNLQNVISRVTGGNASNIDGVLKSDIKNADFYFINPNGITFGANAQVDVPAAFHVSTADKMDFGKNGGVFYADLNKDSKLSSEAPASFGFLGTSKANNGLIDVNGSKLTFKEGQTLDVVAGEIKVKGEGQKYDDSGNIANPNIKVPAGQLRLATLQNEGALSLIKDGGGEMSLPNTASSLKGGKIVSDGGSFDITGNGGGRIAIFSGDILLKNCDLWADNMGDINAISTKDIDIFADTMRFETSIISFAAVGAGNAGDITVNTKTLDAVHSMIWNPAISKGNAGDISVSAVNLNLVDDSEVLSSTFAQGNAGKVSVTSDKLVMDGQLAMNGNQRTSIASTAEPGSTGHAGDITVKADTLEIENGAVIASSTHAQGNAGKILIDANDLTIDGRNYTTGFTGIASGAEAKSTGDAGNVIVNANILKMMDGQIRSGTWGKANAGSVAVTSEKIIIDNKGFEWRTISSNAQKGSMGSAGNVTISASDSFSVMNGAKISIENIETSSSGSLTTGNLSITSPNIEIKNAQITSNSVGNAPAGNISIYFSNHLNMNNSFITTEANTGDGGAIKINGSELIYLKDSGFKTTVSGENGNGGDISVKAEMLIMDTGLIQANAKSGNGGNIDLALQALIPSADTLIKGGKTVEWNSSPSTRNVIQAASQTGVSGTVTSSAPQLNLSGVLANVGNQKFDNNLINQDYCAVGQGSSLALKGKGGLPLRAKDLQVK